jgi:hypothetical protein
MNKYTYYCVYNFAFELFYTSYIIKSTENNMQISLKVLFTVLGDTILA